MELNDLLGTRPANDADIEEWRRGAVQFIPQKCGIPRAAQAVSNDHRIPLAQKIFRRSVFQATEQGRGSRTGAAARAECEAQSCFGGGGFWFSLVDPRFELSQIKGSHATQSDGLLEFRTQPVLLERFSPRQKRARSHPFVFDVQPTIK